MVEPSDSEYEGFFAEFYDILQPGAPDAEPLAGILRAPGGPVLELGCGTGRLLLPFVRSGIETDGIDRSEDMLAICRAKLAAEPADVRDRARLHRADIRSFALDRRYGAVLASNNVVNHLLTTKDLLACFSTVRKHLRSDGVFVVDNSAPDARQMVESSGESEVFEFVHPERGTQLVSRFTPVYDFLEQLERDEIELTENAGDRIVREARTSVVSRFYLPPELRLALAATGFEVVSELGSVRGRPLREGCGEVILVARPSGTPATARE